VSSVRESASQPVVTRLRGPRKRVTTGWEALSRTELTVAYLVGEGRSNPDIAAEMFLSRGTVQTHVSHILTKLGSRSRVEIAREVMSHPRGAENPALAAKSR
jgi:DNA-binding NarL/FixJ family response regulator